VMTGKPAKVIGLAAVRYRWAVGNPDAFSIKVHVTERGVAGGFFRSRAGKERPVEHAQLRMSSGIGDGDGEEAGIFVIDVADLNAMIFAKSCKPQALPVEEVFRHGQCDAGSLGGKCGVRHDVAPQWRYEGDARVLASTATA